MADLEHVIEPFNARLVMIGFGCIGKGALPLLLRHLVLDPQRLLVLSADEDGRSLAREFGVAHRIEPLDQNNYESVLEPLLSAGDFLLNLSVGVSSLDLIQFAQRKGVLYLDTCIEPWEGGYTDPDKSLSERSNYALREAALQLRRENAQSLPTAILTHGANPGLVSHLVKQALVNLAKDLGDTTPLPATRAEWAQLASRLNIRCIHIAERDSQYSSRHKIADEFVNTWSVDGFISEGCQPAELGWGSHEKALPEDGHYHAFGCQAGIYLQRPGAATPVRTWTPSTGPTHGLLVSHNEALSIADYLTIGQGRQPLYRPTVHYAYRPCDDALLSMHELAERNWKPQTSERLLHDDILDGNDELGVLLMGHARNSYWYGSRLSIHQARALCPYNSATSLQVTAGVLAGVIWAIRNPQRGIVEPDELPFREILQICTPYLGKVEGIYSDWTPLCGRHSLMPEQTNESDPWQFVNVRIT
jgi:homospermidine synthase